MDKFKERFFPRWGALKYTCVGEDLGKDCADFLLHDIICILCRNIILG